MKKAEKRVIGKYKNPEDVKATLQRLEREGYTREDITIYSNNSTIQKFEEDHAIDMLSDETKMVKDKENRSFWDRVKGMVSYDDDEDSSLDESENELLEPYKEDIQNGYTIIAARNLEQANRADSARTSTKQNPSMQTEFDEDGAVLYETPKEPSTYMEDPNSTETTRQDDDNGFDAIYETKDNSHQTNEETQFTSPDDFENGVTGDQYLDLEEDQTNNKKHKE